MRACALKRRGLFVRVALVGFVCLINPGRAFGYGVYEEQISGANYIKPPDPFPNLDAPELFSEAFFTPPPDVGDVGLLAIEGTLDPENGDLADMYCIFIGGRFNPADFTVKMVEPFRMNPDNIFQITDPQLFLFDAMGHPVVGNDDTDDVNLQPTIPAGTITKAGVYVLAITGSGYDPVDAALNQMFTNNSTGLKTPTDADAVQDGWSGTHDQSGRYRIDFHNAEGNPTVEHWTPEPNTFGLLLLGLVGLALGRKRS